MLRNFRSTKGWPSLPVLACRKKTGLRVEAG